MKKSKKSPRRPLESRGQQWAKSIASMLTRLRISPNSISVAGLVFACLASLLFAFGGLSRLALLGAAACIQLRLFCNLMDGMVAIEGRLRQKDGDLYNEVPDRLADLLIFIGAGYALPQPWGPALGWSAGCLALLTAYARLFGGTLGQAQDFRGPQSKPQRMAALTAASLFAAAAAAWIAPVDTLKAGLALICLGTLITFLRRLWAIRSGLLNA